VGGRRFETTIDTLKARGENNKLVALVRSPNHVLDHAGCVFIDRDPTLFQCVMHYLRQDKSDAWVYAACMDELAYYGLVGSAQTFSPETLIKRVFQPLLPLKDAVVHKFYPRIEAFYRNEWSLASRPMDVPRMTAFPYQSNELILLFSGRMCYD